MNYNENCVCINTAPGKSLKIEPSPFGELTMVPLTLDEIKFANNGRVFKSGLLEFPEDIESEIYDELRIDPSSVLKLSEIRNILINPNKEGLIKILSVTSMFEFDRVRGQFQKLKHEGYKLTLDVADFINRRTNELFNNQVKSSIQIENNETTPSANDRKVEELEKQIEEMRTLISQSMSIPKEIVTDDNKTVAEDKVDIAKVDVVPEKKPSGRPKKSSI